MEGFPDKESRRLIEHYGAKIAEPQQRLEFVLRSGNAVRDNPANGRMHPLGPWGRRLSALDALCKASLLPTETLEVPWQDRASMVGLRLVRSPFLNWKFALAAGCALIVFTQAPRIGLRDIGVDSAAAHAANATAAPSGPGGLAAGDQTVRDTAVVETYRPAPISEPARLAADRKLDVWLVKADAEGELYSNGLRISNKRLSHTGPRDYGVYSRGPGNETAEIDRRLFAVGRRR